jgi:hypothetical protein
VLPYIEEFLKGLLPGLFDMYLTDRQAQIKFMEDILYLVYADKFEKAERGKRAIVLL